VPAPPPTDAELDVHIRARLQALGIDLSVLPADDPDAPADQVRVLASVRALLRGTIPTIVAWQVDTQAVPPVLYPAQSTAWWEARR